MKDQTLRQSYKEGFWLTSLRDSISVPIVSDNLVCVECREHLAGKEWMLISTPKHKGIALFACMEHVPKAMNLLAVVIDGLHAAPDDLTLPNAAGYGR